MNIEDYIVKFDPKTYQKSKVFQKYHKKFAIWANMEKLYQGKKSYYSNGTSILTDDEYDSLERQITVFTNKDFLKQWSCVGYNEDVHRAVTRVYNYFKNEIDRRFTIPWNEHARGSTVAPPIVVMKAVEKIEKYKAVVIVNNNEVKEAVEVDGQFCFNF